MHASWMLKDVQFTSKMLAVPIVITIRTLHHIKFYRQSLKKLVVSFSYVDTSYTKDPFTIETYLTKEVGVNASAEKARSNTELARVENFIFY